jgi:hypothetical protein
LLESWGFRVGATPLKARGRRQKGRIHVTDDDLTARHESTTLDRVYAAMLLQASGRANALRALLKAEQQRSPEREAPRRGHAPGGAEVIPSLR